jgi:sugar lactone lactonase YvrE
MDQLFIVSATSELSGKGRQAQWPQSGDVYAVTIPGVKGLERLRFRG